MTIETVQTAKTKDEARQFAIDWQNWSSERSMAYSELTDWQEVFRELASQFGLYDEFKENGII